MFYNNTKIDFLQSSTELKMKKIKKKKFLLLFNARKAHQLHLILPCIFVFIGSYSFSSFIITITKLYCQPENYELFNLLVYSIYITSTFFTLPSFLYLSDLFPSPPLWIFFFSQEILYHFPSPPYLPLIHNKPCSDSY